MVQKIPKLCLKVFECLKLKNYKKILKKCFWPPRGSMGPSGPLGTPYLTFLFWSGVKKNKISEQVYKNWEKGNIFHIPPSRWPLAAQGGPSGPQKGAPGGPHTLKSIIVSCFCNNIGKFSQSNISLGFLCRFYQNLDNFKGPLKQHD